MENSTSAEAASRDAKRPRKLDVDATIRSRAKTVASADLARRHKNVQVLGVGTIRQLIKDAVTEALVHLQHSIGEEQRRRLVEEAEEEFQERLAAFQAEKAGLEARTHHLQDQLSRAQELLEEERQKIVSADQFTVSDAGIVELERRLGRMFDRAIKGGGVSQDLETEMRGVVSKLLDDERELIRARAEEAQNDRVQLLEKKINRLSSTLEDTQKERDKANRRAQLLEESGGSLRNVISGGIGDEDPDRERRLLLMKAIFQENEELHAKLRAEGRIRFSEPPSTSSEGLPSKANVPPPSTSSAPGSPADGADATAQGEPETPAPESRSHPTESQPLESPVHESSPAFPERVEVDESAMDLESSENESDSEVNPDDLPWEPPTDFESEIIIRSTSGVPCVSVGQKAPPPLLRRASHEEAQIQENESLAH